MALLKCTVIDEKIHHNSSSACRNFSNNQKKIVMHKCNRYSSKLFLRVILQLFALHLIYHYRAVDGFIPPKKTQQQLLLDEQRCCLRHESCRALYFANNEDHQSQPEICIRSESSSGSSVPSGTKKHSSRKKRKGRIKSKKHGLSPISEDDLAQHVSTQYLVGGGGLINTVDAKRKRQQKKTPVTYETDPDHKDHVEYIKKLDRHPSLVLNADYQPLCYLPLSIWSWQETIKAVFSGKVHVVDVYPEISIRAVNMNVPLPSVIALTDFVSQPHHRPAFTRRNVFLRDGYRCQYCSKCYKTADLSLDHVVPRCMGGKLEWENAVTCCKKCNGRKGSTLPSELSRVGMKLLRQPHVPSKYELSAVAGKMLPRRIHATWKPFLGMQDKPEESSVEGQKINNNAMESIFDELL